MELIDREALLAAYDAAHKGPPGGARKLIEEAPAVEAVPLDRLCRYLEVYARTPIYNMQHTAEWWKEEIRERKLREMDGGTKCC